MLSKTQFNLVLLSILIILSSCKSSFTKQKFTNLRHKKIESETSNYKKSDSQNKSLDVDNGTIQTKNNFDQNEQSINKEILKESVQTVFEESFRLQLDEGEPDSTEIAIETAIRRNHTFIIHLNGGTYKLENPYYDKESQTIQGDIVFMQNIDNIEGDKIELNISEYEVLGSNGLAADLVDIELISSINNSPYTEDPSSSNTNETSAEDKTKGFVFIIIAALAIIGGIILGMPFTVMGILLGLVFLMLASVAFKKKSSSPEKKTEKEKQKTESENQTKKNTLIIMTTVIVSLIAAGLIAAIYLLSLIF